MRFLLKSLERIREKHLKYFNSLTYFNLLIKYSAQNKYLSTKEQINKYISALNNVELRNQGTGGDSRELPC